MLRVWVAVIAIGCVLLAVACRADGEVSVPLGEWDVSGIEYELAPRRDQVLQRMISRYLVAQGLPVIETAVCLADDRVMDGEMPADTVGYALPGCIVLRRSWSVREWPPTGADVQVRVHELLHTIREVPEGYGWWPAVDRDIAERAVQAATLDLAERFALRSWPNSLRARLSLFDGYGVGWVRAASASAAGGGWQGNPARSWRYALVRADRWGRRAMLRAAGVKVPE